MTLYVTYFLANTISQFEVDAEGVATKSVGNVDRQNLQPPGDTKEMWTDSAGKWCWPPLDLIGSGTDGNILTEKLSDTM